MNNVTELQEISPNVWQAKYTGNYGIYTINIKTEGKKIIKSSCSCPSQFYPCKHIPIVEKAIRERIAKNKKGRIENETAFEQILKDLPQDKLYDFIMRQIQTNPQLKEAVLSEFAIHKENESSIV